MHNHAVFVPHFHWDREWYEPFQVFRHRLVDAVDTVLATAEADPGFRFTMDGQTAAVEDYLAIRPENRARVEALVAGGQLALGPWYILLDEFLCSGETIVRNLRFGWQDAAALGHAMPVGYLPDMFGHVAQMPQILRRAGIGHAALWRGVPASVDGHAFLWEAPDGSQVRTEFFFDGYDNGLDIVLVPDALGRALDDYTRMTAGRWGADPVLAMVGTDHTAPHPALADWVAAARRPDRDIRFATIEEYVTAEATDPVSARVRGELRSHVRGNILPGVLSVRAELKKAMAVAERTVDHAERFLAAWGGPAAAEEAGFLELAWRKIVESSAHDSVVGSGTDETSAQVLARLEEAAQAARAVRDAALARRGAAVPADAWLIANPLPTPRTAIVELSVESDAPAFTAVTGEGELLPAQIVSTAETVLADETVDAQELERVLRRIHRRELFGKLIDRYELTPHELVFHLADVPERASFDLIELREAVAVAARQSPGAWHVRTLAAPVATVAVAVPVAASGSTAVRVTGAQTTAPSPHAAAEVFGEASAPGLRNGLVTASVTPDGLIDLVAADGTELRGVGRLVDGGDRGDSYNYGPPAQDVLIDRPVRVEVSIVENGPVRAALMLVREYAWPAALAADPDERSAELEAVRVETLVELRVGEPFLRMTVSFVNPSADHRVRLHVPLPAAVEGSSAAGQFAVTDRGLTSEGGWGEFPLPTFPAESFVAAGSAVVLLDHLSEYELVDGGAELAITLLRAVGAISVNLHPLRDEPAAIHIKAPGAQQLGGTVTTRLAVLPAAGGWREAGAVAAAELFRQDAVVARGLASAGGALPAADEGVRVRGDDVQVSAVRRDAAGVELRLVALSPDAVDVTVTGAFAGTQPLDLLGRPLEPGALNEGALADAEAAGTARLTLAPWEIRTLRLLDDAQRR